MNFRKQHISGPGTVVLTRCVLLGTGISHGHRREVGYGDSQLSGVKVIMWTGGDSMQWRDHLSTNFAFPPGYSKSSCPATSEQRAGRAAIGTQLAIPILINLLHEVYRSDLTRDVQIPTITALSGSLTISSKLSLSAPSAHFSLQSLVFFALQWRPLHLRQKFCPLCE